MDMTKNLEMRPHWVNWMVPKSGGQCLDKERRNGGQPRGEDCEDRQRGSHCLQAACRAGAGGREVALPTASADFDPLASRTVRK